MVIKSNYTIEKSILNKKKKNISYEINIEEIIEIFEEYLIFFARNNKHFYELFFKNGLILKNIFIEKICKSFIFYFIYKTKGVKAKILNLNNYLSDSERHRLNLQKKRQKIINKKTRIKFKRKTKKLTTLVRRYYKKPYWRTMDKIKKRRIARFFKSKMDGRFMRDQNAFYFKKSVIGNLIKYNNFGIIVKKPKKIILTKTKFQLTTKLICGQFFQKLLVSVYKNYRNFNFSVYTQKFYTRIFDFCMARDLKITGTHNFFIKDEVLDSEDLDNAEEDVDVLKFCSGLTVKFAVTRRNFFFQIWDDVSGFTLATISAGVFGYYFKKSIKRFRNFNMFFRFFKYYFNSIMVAYKYKVLKKFIKLRRIASKQFRKKILKVNRSTFNTANTNKIKNNNLRYLIVTYIRFLKTNPRNFLLRNFNDFVCIYSKQQIYKVFPFIDVALPSYINKRKNLNYKINLNLEKYLLCHIFNKTKKIKIKKFKIRKRKWRRKKLFFRKLGRNQLFFNFLFMKNFLNSNLMFITAQLIFFSIFFFNDYRSRNKYIKNSNKIKKKIRISNGKFRPGLSFIYFHRSKLNLTYIITMRKIFFHKKKFFSSHWLALYKRIKKFCKINKKKFKMSPFKVFKKQFKFRMYNKSALLIYNLFSLKKKNRKNFIKFKINKEDKKKIRNFKKYIKTFNNKTNKFKKFKIKSLNKFFKLIDYRVENNYNIMMNIKIIKALDKKIKKLCIAYKNKNDQ